MMDMETKSLWSQISGESIQGVNKGSKLKQFPASHSTFAEFKRDYPNGQLLKKETKGESGSHYKNYFMDKKRLGIFDRVDNFQRLEGKDMILGLKLEPKEVAVAESYLAENGFALIESEENFVLLAYDKKSEKTAAYFLPDIQGEFDMADIVKDGQIKDKESGRSWDIFTGKTIKGEGDDLIGAPLTRAYWFAWASFFPDTELIK